MSDQFIGEIRNFGFNFAPAGWAMCQGQVMLIAQNQALFALLGTTYGGNGTTNFCLPNLIGRAPIGIGTEAGLTPITQGQVGGQNSVALTIAELPPHTHAAVFTPSGGGGTPTVNVSVQASSGTADTSSPTGNYLAGTAQGASGRNIGGLYTDTPGTTGPIAGVSATISGVPGGGGTVTNALAGSGIPFPIEPPFLGCNWCIALTGVYPTRS